jgi:hypothetical protein
MLAEVVRDEPTWMDVFGIERIELGPASCPQAEQSAVGRSQSEHDENRGISHRGWDAVVRGLWR